MSLFQRALRLFLLIAGFVAGLAASVALLFSRWMVHPPRQPLWATPADVGLPFERVAFPARDGLRLSGWFIHGGAGDAPRPTVILVHGWPWNRLGEGANHVLGALMRAQPVDLLRLMLSLQHAGYNVLAFDLRNHGESAAAPPVTFGLHEADDLLGALDYLADRGDVDQARIAAIGFSMGANALLYALPHTDRLQAAVAVQPTSPGVFAPNLGYDLMGPLSKLVLPLAEMLYQAQGGLPFAAIEPIFAAAGAGETPVLYVQGSGDKWGSADNVARMAAATPNAVAPLFVDSNGRFGGYQYVVNNPDVVLGFLAKQM